LWLCGPDESKGDASHPSAVLFVVSGHGSRKHFVVGANDAPTLQGSRRDTGTTIERARTAMTRTGVAPPSRARCLLAPPGMSHVRTFLLALVTMLLGCSSVDFHTAISPTATFDRYRTFAFDTHPAVVSMYATSARSEDVAGRIRLAVTSLLQAKGYALAKEGSSDVVVRVAVGERERETVVRGLQPSRLGWLDENETVDFSEGAFVIDVFDVTTGDLVYHGAARTEIDPEHVDEQRLRGAVGDVMAPFPARVGPK
jgi:Domain of unknown function (DUF4136)